MNRTANFVGLNKAAKDAAIKEAVAKAEAGFAGRLAFEASTRANRALVADQAKRSSALRTIHAGPARALVEKALAFYAEAPLAERGEVSTTIVVTDPVTRKRHAVPVQLPQLITVDPREWARMEALAALQGTPGLDAKAVDFARGRFARALDRGVERLALLNGGVEVPDKDPLPERKPKAQDAAPVDKPAEPASDKDFDAKVAKFLKESPQPRSKRAAARAS
ncbi:hypothetical protein IPM09_01795 [Candidatus Saccharibacteria bacterium]|nr:MAG: hypothetical protein IPM09_01795 [Candidatus Saccharibacteria bacterium]